MNNNKKIVVGMSGGVDSSMSLVLLKKQGWKPVGVSLRYAVWQNEDNLLRENVCCSAESFKIAKNICQKLNVPHHIFDVSEEFHKEVIDYFIQELKNNRTPNPCIICNRYLKFKKLFEWAEKHNIEYVATGHYARTKKSKNNEYQLLKARDGSKDQTYSLSFLPQRWLKNIIFPLGTYTKDEVFKIAEKQGFDFYLKRKESQNFCFVSNNCLNCFLKEEIGTQKGPIKNTKGKLLGQHQGLHFFTIGQRKGINLPDGPYYVVDKIAEKNSLIVSRNRRDLLSKKAVLSPVNFISGQPLTEKTRVESKIRSQHTPAESVLKPIDDEKIKIILNEPQPAVTPGQFAVFYQKDICLGGGRVLTTE